MAKMAEIRVGVVNDLNDAEKALRTIEFKLNEIVRRLNANEEEFDSMDINNEARFDAIEARLDELEAPTV